MLFFTQQPLGIYDAADIYTHVYIKRKNNMWINILCRRYGPKNDHDNSADIDNYHDKSQIFI